MPSHIQRHSGNIIALPAIAASTCSHTPCRSATAAIAATGSIAVVAVVPVVATMAQGRAPAAISARIFASRSSGRMAKSASTATSRRLSRPNPASSAALSTELWLCPETYTVSTRPAACSPPRTAP